MAVPLEIERKFLVEGDEWRRTSSPTRIRQGYLSQPGGVTVRVRRMDRNAKLTIKSARKGPVRAEFEYQIPTEHADYLLSCVCDHPPVEKVRHELVVDGQVWVVDEFSGLNTGLILAEVELDHASQQVSLPDWVGREVTGDARFSNSSLYRQPYLTWDMPTVQPRRKVG